MIENYFKERVIRGSWLKYEVILFKVFDVELELYDRILNEC